ncbi:hypothetical protein BRADI_3g02612v3 [Brachypodium distachyon]|uniref:Uncharacterized protein n=1 Tax=Brachypodium distachyon TaxID=15368 RepID=I1HWR7_BRADI|nr:hypothetical protein BRADI_3g02612v3 [Brachypodium distachyon]
MGLPFSALTKFGLPRISSVAIEQVYDRYFKEKETSNFADFHIACVDFCKYFNTIMPGQDFYTPTLAQLKEFYENTWKPEKEDQKKKFIEYMQEHTRQINDDKLFIMAGLAAPAAAIVAKRSGESIPQIKKFKLHIVPNVVFVPFCTLLAIMGATAMKMNKKSKANQEQNQEKKATESPLP